jgi:hypothetical protein
VVLTKRLFDRFRQANRDYFSKCIYPILEDRGHAQLVRGSTMIVNLLDHGLPLVALKEQRRDLIMSLIGHHGSIAKEAITEIAAIQSAIMAIETVISDLDEELCSSIVPNKARSARCLSS